jgi:hypothetical protein
VRRGCAAAQIASDAAGGTEATGCSLLQEFDAAGMGGCEAGQYFMQGRGGLRAVTEGALFHRGSRSVAAGGTELERGIEVLGEEQRGEAAALEFHEGFIGSRDHATGAIQQVLDELFRTRLFKLPAEIIDEGQGLRRV